MTSDDRVASSNQTLLDQGVSTPAWLGIVWSALAGGVPFLVYLGTLAPTVYGLDSAELTTGAYVLGIVHAPGSPTYLLLGHLFSRLPIGDVGYRLNLMSAVSVAVSLTLFFHAVNHLIRNRLVSLPVTWFLAFTYYVWIAAVAAELYAVQAAFLSGLLLLAVRWRDGPKGWHLPVFALTYGLGLGVHISLVLLIPGFLFLLFSEGRWRNLSPRTLVTTVVGGLLGLSVFLYLPIRYASSPRLNYAQLCGVDLTTLSGFLWMLSGRMFGSLMFGVPLSHVPRELLAYVHQLWSTFLGVGVVLGAIGFVEDIREDWGVRVSLLAMLIAHLVFYLPYQVGDKALMFLPTFVVWGLLVGLGAHGVSRALAEQRLPVVGPAVYLALAAFALVYNHPYADISQDWSARQLGETTLRSLAPDAVFLGTWKEVPILEYLQIVENKRLDVSVYNLLFLDDEGSRVIVTTALSEGLPVYTTASSFLDSSQHELHRVSACECYRVISKSDDPVDPNYKS